MPFRELQQVPGETDVGRVRAQVRPPPVGLPQPSGDRADQGPHDLGMRGHERPERLGGHDDHLRGLHRHDRRRTGLTVDDRHLADEITGATMGEQGLVTALGDGHDLHPTRPHDHY